MADYVVFLSFLWQMIRIAKSPSRDTRQTRWLPHAAGTDCYRFSRPAKSNIWFAQSYRDWELNHVDFSGADLRGTRFVNMSLHGCDFSKADLRCADFIRCDLRRANFDNAIFGYNRFEKSCLIDATGISKRLRSDITAEGGSFWYC